MKITLIWVLLILGSLKCEETETRNTPKITFRVCSCSLNKHEGLKQFLENDAPEFGDLLTVEYVQNAKPVIFVKYDKDATVEEIDILGFNRTQLRNKLSELDIKPYFPLEELPFDYDL